MKILCGLSYHVSHGKLTQTEQDLCDKAVALFCKNPNHPGLNFEHLSKRLAHNHHSIRASKELRIILGVEPGRHDPRNIVLAHAGHHDSAYKWSHRHGSHTDMATGVPLSDVNKETDGLSQRLKEFATAKDWQLFLHPEQEALVHKKFFGEARILGAVGTGKTVLALHRAAWLGNLHPDGKVLFTTFSRSLTTHYKYLYQGIPNAPLNVAFINIDLLAFRIVGKSLGRKVDEQGADAHFDNAWREIAQNSSLSKLPPEYLKDEIKRVIKGRGAARDEYLDTDQFQRVGRKRGLKRNERKICWDLKEAWDERLKRENLTIIADVIIAARNIARQGGGQYQSIIIDEYQDITLVSAQFLRALVAGNEGGRVPNDGLLFFGDAAQRIYPGGWQPVWANLSFRGRSETLHTNYRNTRFIVEAASAVRGTDKTGADADEHITKYKKFAWGDGVRPVFFSVSAKQEILTIKREIERLVRDESIPHEEIGILVYHNKDAKIISEEFIKRSIPCFLLRRMRYKPAGQGVRVGTYDRGKGMEFQAVLLPRLGESQFPESFVRIDPEQKNVPGLDSDEISDEEKEHRQLQLDRLYVGMTRAVRFLYLLADEKPCEELQNAKNHFDWK